MDSAAKRLGRVPARWHGNPVLVSEHGFRREAHRHAIRIFRERPYVAGASMWSCNDYRGRYPPGPDAQGYRQWGVLDADCKPRPADSLLAAEYSPVLISAARAAAGETTVSAVIQARADFPSYTLRDYFVRTALLEAAGVVLETDSHAIPVLQPGEALLLQARMKLPAAAKAAGARVEVVRPTGLVMASVGVSIP